MKEEFKEKRFYIVEDQTNNRVLNKEKKPLIATTQEAAEAILLSIMKYNEAAILRGRRRETVYTTISVKDFEYTFGE